MFDPEIELEFLIAEKDFMESKYDQDDIGKNLDDWIEGKQNLLFVIGNAGSGKSYLMNELKKHHPDAKLKCVDLDHVYTAIYLPIGKGVEHAADYVNINKDVITAAAPITKNLSMLPQSSDYDFVRPYVKRALENKKLDTADAKFRWCFARIRQAATADRTTRYIFAGIQTQNVMKSQILGTFPVIIKGTGIKTALQSKADRIIGDTPEKRQEFINSQTVIDNKVTRGIHKAGEALKYQSTKGSLGYKVGDMLSKKSQKPVTSYGLHKTANRTITLRNTWQKFTGNKINGTAKSNDKRLDQIRKDFKNQEQNNPEYGKVTQVPSKLAGETRFDIDARRRAQGSSGNLNKKDLQALRSGNAGPTQNKEELIKLKDIKDDDAKK